MPRRRVASPEKDQRKIERIAPYLVALAQGKFAIDVAADAGVSSITVLNWMDWSSKRPDQVEAYLREQFPDITDEDVANLWTRVRQRRTRRLRRLDLTDVLARR